MNPTNSMSMHDLVRAEHALRASQLEHKRIAHEAMAAKAVASHATDKKASHHHVPSIFARAHRRAALAAATVAMLLAVAAGAAVASPLQDTANNAKPAAAVHGPSGGHAPRVQ